MFPPTYLLPTQPARPKHWHPPPERSPARREAAITGVCVAVGLGAALVSLPPARTPGHAAEAYVQAGIQEEWREAWALLCRSARDAVSFTAYREQMAYVNEYTMAPSEVEVEVEGVRGQADRQVVVSVTLTSPERNRENWEDRGEVPVVLEDGHFRVCPATLPVS